MRPGLKGDIDDEREPLILTDGRTNRLIRHRDAGMHLKHEFRLIFCAVNVSFLHFS